MQASQCACHISPLSLIPKILVSNSHPNDSWLSSLGAGESFIEAPSNSLLDSPSKHKAVSIQFSPPRLHPRPSPESKSAGEIVNEMLARVPGILGHLQVSSPERAAHLIELVSDIHASQLELSSSNDVHMDQPPPSRHDSSQKTSPTVTVTRAPTPFASTAWSSKLKTTSATTIGSSYHSQPSMNSSPPPLSRTVQENSQVSQSVLRSGLSDGVHYHSHTAPTRSRTVVSTTGNGRSGWVTMQGTGGGAYGSSSTMDGMLPVSLSGIPWC